jgi:uncharacterized damage-inducible protein DinB
MVDLLERLIGHDVWTTRVLLERCGELTGVQLDQPFEMDHQTVRATLVHMIGNMEVWTDLMAERPVPAREHEDSLAALTARHERAGAAFLALARDIAASDRLEDRWTDVLDDPPRQKTYGGAIAHVITHDMHHRAQLLWLLARLGLCDLPEGDLLSWEMHTT